MEIGGVNFNGQPLEPDEAKALIEYVKTHNLDHQQREQEEELSRLQKRNFLTSLKPDDLVMLRQLIQGAGGENSMVAAYLCGEINAILTYVHNIDIKTGHNIYDQLHKAGTQEGH